MIKPIDSACDFIDKYFGQPLKHSEHCQALRDLIDIASKPRLLDA